MKKLVYLIATLSFLISSCSSSIIDTSSLSTTYKSCSSSHHTDRNTMSTISMTGSSVDKKGESMHLYINGNTIEVELEENDTVRALIEILQESDIIFDVRDYGGFEKVGALGLSLPTNYTYIQAVPGDIMLYQSNQITIFYGSNSWSYTKIGHIVGYDETEMPDILGAGLVNMKIRFSII